MSECLCVSSVVENSLLLKFFITQKSPPVSLHTPIYRVFQNLFLNYEDGWLVGSLVISDLFAMFYV
jgi:hypothetical protein